MSPADRMLRAALNYASRGWPVIPLAESSKLPKISKDRGGRGFKDATTDTDVIRDWWGRWPDANLGVATGAASGIVILDIDGRNNGFASLDTLVAEHGAFLPTLTADTGSGGRHLVFQFTGELEKRNGLYPGIDLLSTGGYFVAPPSLHPCGERYCWRADVVAIAEAPGWLLEAARARRGPLSASSPPRAAARLPQGDSTRYGLRALASEAEALASTPPGTRNHTLNAKAFSLGRLVVAGHLGAEEVEEALLEASGRNGYLAEARERAVRRVIASGMAAGMQAGPRGPSRSSGTPGPDL